MFNRYNLYSNTSDKLDLNRFLSFLHDKFIPSRLRDLIDSISVDIPLPLYIDGVQDMLKIKSSDKIDAFNIFNMGSNIGDMELSFNDKDKDKDDEVKVDGLLNVSERDFIMNQSFIQSKMKSINKNK